MSQPLFDQLGSAVAASAENVLAVAQCQFNRKYIDTESSTADRSIAEAQDAVNDAQAHHTQMMKEGREVSAEFNRIQADYTEKYGDGSVMAGALEWQKQARVSKAEANICIGY